MSIFPINCILYYCYLITNVINLKKYVGFAVDPDERWKEHLKKMLVAEKDMLYMMLLENMVKTISHSK